MTAIATLPADDGPPGARRDVLTRRGFERRAAVLSAAALLFVAVFIAMRIVDDAGSAVGVLAIVPVTLVALETGLRGGVAAAAIAIALIVVNAADHRPSLDALGIATRAFVLAAVGTVAGRFSDVVRTAYARERRLLESGLQLTALPPSGVLPALVGEAALTLTRAVGADVEIAAAPSARVGRRGGARTSTAIRLRERAVGNITVEHDTPLDAGERAALELLALQTALAYDARRTVGLEHQRAAAEQQLAKLRERLNSSRAGLGALLDTQEAERRKIAGVLHEDLAQVVAAALMGVRMLQVGATDDDGPRLEDLQQQLVGVLRDMRSMASGLAPPVLDQLGLRPALTTLVESAQAEHGRRVQLDVADLPPALPAPVAIAAYRIVESVLGTAAAWSGDAAPAVALAAAPDELRITLELAGDEDSLHAVLNTVRARVDGVGGALDVDAAALTTLKITVPMTASSDTPEGAAQILNSPASP